MGSIALHLRPTDSSALHYRHVATSVTRQLLGGKTVSEVALSRARGYVCSSLDPVTGGKHCAIGGSAYEFIVTSTLASQAPPAVGRALAIPLSNRLLISSKEHGHEIGKKKSMFPSDAISYVSFGEGSVNNAHFLSALNLAKYSQHRGVKVRITHGCRSYPQPSIHFCTINKKNDLTVSSVQSFLRYLTTISASVSEAICGSRDSSKSAESHTSSQMDQIYRVFSLNPKLL